MWGTFDSDRRGEVAEPQRDKTKEDYGLIVGIHPHLHPDKTWIACAGLGEHGTSGAAHLLAFGWDRIVEAFQVKFRQIEGKYKQLRTKIDISTFACIVKTRTDSDDSADIFNFALIEDQWEEYPGPQSPAASDPRDCAVA